MVKLLLPNPNYSINCTFSNGSKGRKRKEGNEKNVKVLNKRTRNVKVLNKRTRRQFEC